MVLKQIQRHFDVQQGSRRDNTQQTLSTGLLPRQVIWFQHIDPHKMHVVKILCGRTLLPTSRFVLDYLDILESKLAN